MPKRTIPTRRAKSGTPASAAQTETANPAAPGLLSSNQQLGNWLVYLRRNHPIPNQADFAKRLGVKRSYIAAVEAGGVPLKLKVAWDACRILNIHPDFLMGMGKAAPAPFPALSESETAKADAILTTAHAATFVDAWAALRSMLFDEQTPATPAPEPVLSDDMLKAMVARLKRLAKRPDGKARIARVTQALKD